MDLGFCSDKGHSIITTTTTNMTEPILLSSSAAFVVVIEEGSTLRVRQLFAVIQKLANEFYFV